MTLRIDQNVFRLYAITADGAALDPSSRRRARAWLEGGVRTIQLREKMLDRSEVIPFGRFLRAITAEYGALLIVNDDPELAAEVNADGCHLGQDDAPIARARGLLGDDKLLGLSTHNREQVLAASASGADYIGVGPVFASSTKDVGRPLVGPELAGWAAREVAQPVVAIGGITLGNVARIASAGCRNVAVVSALNESPRPDKLVRAFLDILHSADPANLP